MTMTTTAPTSPSARLFAAAAGGPFDVERWLVTADAFEDVDDGAAAAFCRWVAAKAVQPWIGQVSVYWWDKEDYKDKLEDDGCLPLILVKAVAEEWNPQPGGKDSFRRRFDGENRITSAYSALLAAWRLLWAGGWRVEGAGQGKGVGR